MKVSKFDEIQKSPVIIAATGNRGKMTEISRILAPLNMKIISIRDAGIYGMPDETGSSFAENARIKAEYIYRVLTDKGLRDFIPIADDSGLIVNALKGAPGIYSARYGGVYLTDSERTEKLLNEMRDVKVEDRTAYFICVVYAINQNGNGVLTEGICKGKIATEISGGGGFGYDPVFIPDEGGGKTMAELTDAEKNAISHRGIALRNLSEIIKERYTYPK